LELHQESPAGQAAGEAEERFVEVGAAFIADEQASPLVQPCEGAFDDPAVAAEPRAVPAEAACDYGFDAARPELAAVGVMVVAAVSNDTIGPAVRAASAGREPRGPDRRAAAIG
jgi:hypothetical protein